MYKLTQEEIKRREDAVRLSHKEKTAKQIASEFDIPLAGVYEVANLFGVQCAGGRGIYLKDRAIRQMQTR